MNHDEAAAFAEQWAKDWNNHDVEAVLAHFADDVVFTYDWTMNPKVDAFLKRQDKWRPEFVKLRAIRLELHSLAHFITSGTQFARHVQRPR